jgi:triosephosphate isomerase
MVDRLLIAGNWKMNLDKPGAIELTEALTKRQDSFQGVDVAVFPPSLWLTSVGNLLRSNNIKLGGQDCHEELEGAHTGDISAKMLKDVGCDYVILGHSERRANHSETNKTVKKKVRMSLECNLCPIVCVGETWDERNKGTAISAVSVQLKASIPEEPDNEQFIVAYEPVWAIGSGRTPTLNDIQEMHSSIKETLLSMNSRANKIRIVYGGSVKPENAAEIFKIENVGGALVGGASLSATDFGEIISIAGAKN